MNTNRRRGAASPSTGIASLLLIAVILCLTAFGVLAFASARADLKLTEANARTVGAYYTVRGEAQRTLAQLDGLLQGEPDAASALSQALSLQPEAQHTQTSVSYIFPLGEETALSVTVRLEPDGSGAQYTVISEQIIEIGQREDETLELWSGS